MERVRIGLAGVGWIGSEHGRNILKNASAELAAVCDADAARTRAFLAANAHECATFTDYAKFLRADLDAVVIATPNGLHAKMCIAAAKAGKHVFCEKPMAITLDDCRRVREAVEKASVKYLIGYHRRLNPLYQHVKRLLDDGTLGKPFLVESDYLHHVPGDLDIWSWLGKESVAGSLFHAGSGHNVDLIRFFLGDVVEVACMKGIFLPRKEQVETEDTAAALFRFESGGVGLVRFCLGPILPFTFAFRLLATRGSVVDNRVWLDTIPRFDQPGHEKDSIELPAHWVPDNVQGGVSETWGKLIDHFVQMLKADAPCINDVASAYQTSVACFAAVEAARRNAVVSVKEMEGRKKVSGTFCA